MKSIHSFIALLFLSMPAIQAATEVTPAIKPVSFVQSSTFSVFGAFHVHRQQAGVALAWNVTANNVTEFIIERSYDGANFEIIDRIPPALGTWNRYKDDLAGAGYIHYRIKAVMSDGFTEYSATEMVRIVKRG